MHADPDRTVDVVDEESGAPACTDCGRTDADEMMSDGDIAPTHGPKKYRRALPPIMQPWHARPKPSAPECQADGGQQGHG